MNKEKIASLFLDINVDKNSKNNLKLMILSLLENNNYGLTIEDVSRILRINRSTASKYLFALVSEGIVVVRDIGKAKLHYLKKHYGDTIV